jgi:hypothetical protein
MENYMRKNIKKSASKSINTARLAAALIQLCIVEAGASSQAAYTFEEEPVFESPQSSLPSNPMVRSWVGTMNLADQPQSETLYNNRQILNALDQGGKALFIKLAETKMMVRGSTGCAAMPIIQGLRDMNNQIEAIVQISLAGGRDGNYTVQDQQLREEVMAVRGRYEEWRRREGRSSTTAVELGLLRLEIEEDRALGLIGAAISYRNLHDGEDLTRLPAPIIIPVYRDRGTGRTVGPFGPASSEKALQLYSEAQQAAVQHPWAEQCVYTSLVHRARKSLLLFQAACYGGPRRLDGDAVGLNDYVEELESVGRQYRIPRPGPVSGVVCRIHNLGINRLARAAMSRAGNRMRELSLGGQLCRVDGE